MITLTNRSRRTMVIVLAGDAFRWYTGADGKRIASSLTIFPGKTTDPLPNEAAKLGQVATALQKGTLKLQRLAPAKKAPAKKTSKKSKPKK
jgi:hypothetical protein